LDPSPVSLNGHIYRTYVPPLSWPANTAKARVPSSGVPPYTYSSSDATKASVDNTGMVHSEQNGTATITVTDSAKRSGSYLVTVSNVISIVGLGQGNYSTASQNASNRGLSIPSFDQLKAIYSLYGNTFPMGNANYWSSTAAPLSTRWVKNLVTGAESKLSVIINANAIGIGVF
ncbi:MAG TPA: Ig-like domain-containing protein, partial [Pseudomonas sp.]|nr:Ig-like domain-containing protein [Pseudomonas sp.]